MKCCQEAFQSELMGHDRISFCGDLKASLVFNHHAPSNCRQEFTNATGYELEEKMCAYEQRVREVEYSSLIPGRGWGLVG